MIEQYVETLKSYKGSITFPPSNAEQIQEVNNTLKKYQFSTIPEEYQTFLERSNGYTYNGVEFFGTISHPREAKGYIFPDLTITNIHYSQYSFFNNKIIIGRVSESMMLYDKSSDTYAVVDRLTLRSRVEVRSFEELLDIFLEICNY